MSAKSDSLPGIIAVVSHRRSGTHLTIDTVRHNVGGISDQFLTLETILPTHHDHCPLPLFVQKMGTSDACIIKTHALPELEEFRCDPLIYSVASELMSRAKVIYAIRDGRDVMVSFYEYRRKFDAALADVSFSDFLRQPLPDGNRPAQSWAGSVQSWASRPGICVIPYEHYHADYPGTVRHIGKFLGLPVRTPPFDMVVSRNPVAAKVSTAVLFRRGSTQDHKTYFSPADYRFFEEEAGAAMATYTAALREFTDGRLNGVRAS
jgi:hypothetical protein